MLEEEVGKRTTTEGMDVLHEKVCYVKVEHSMEGGVYYAYSLRTWSLSRLQICMQMFSWLIAPTR